MLWRDVAEGWGATREALWPPGPRRGRRPRQTAQCLLPAAFPVSLLSATKTPGADGETEGMEEKETEGGESGLANEHNTETDRDHPDPLPTPLHSSLGTDLSIPHGHAAALSATLLLRDPVF